MRNFTLLIAIAIRDCEISSGRCVGFQLIRLSRTNFYKNFGSFFYFTVDRFHALFLSLCTSVLLERRDRGKVAFHTAAEKRGETEKKWESARVCVYACEGERERKRERERERERKKERKRERDCLTQIFQSIIYIFFFFLPKSNFIRFTKCVLCTYMYIATHTHTHTHTNRVQLLISICFVTHQNRLIWFPCFKNIRRYKPQCEYSVASG